MTSILRTSGHAQKARGHTGQNAVIKAIEMRVWIWIIHGIMVILNLRIAGSILEFWKTTWAWLKQKKIKESI